MKRRLDDAIVVRDAALTIMRAQGTRRPIEKMGTYLHWEGPGLKMLFRTPFQKLPPMSGKLIRQAALRGLRVEDNLPYGLDIWTDARGKVFNFEWNDRGATYIAGFRRGPWESEVLTLATQAYGPNALPG